MSNISKIAFSDTQVLTQIAVELLEDGKRIPLLYQLQLRFLLFSFILCFILHTQAFPWLVKVVVISPRLELLCGGVIATSTVVLVPAHCVTGIPTETIRVLVGQKKTDSDSIHDVAYHVSHSNTVAKKKSVYKLWICCTRSWLNFHKVTTKTTTTAFEFSYLNTK